MAPMTSSKLWSAARDMTPLMIGIIRFIFKNILKHYSSISSFSISIFTMLLSFYLGENGSRTGLDSPYVVHFHNCRVLTKAQALFKFSHPNKLPVDLIDNSRYATLTFISNENTTIHGFAGTFDCTLYKDITFSTVPHSFSTGMFSW
jgi:hypothetical protein